LNFLYVFSTVAKIVRTYNRSVNIGIKKEKVDASTTEKEGKQIFFLLVNIQ
jgi:hypothetical protein